MRLRALLPTLLVLAAGGCGGSDGDSSGDGAKKRTPASFGTIGLLLPEKRATRYESFDRPLFRRELIGACPRCRLLYANAEQDAGLQAEQARSMLNRGAKVLVLDPVDGEAAESIVREAQDRGVGVVAYDRLPDGPVDYYVSFDNLAVGQLQGQALLDALQRGGDPRRGSVVMIHGSPADSNSDAFKRGAHLALDGKIKVGREHDTPDWSPERASELATEAIDALGKRRVIGFYAANDGLAEGIAAAVRRAGLRPFPPITGQDAELRAIQRIVAGEQEMTVFKAIQPEAEAAASMAVAVLQGRTYPQANRTTSNGTRQVPTQLLNPVAVTRANIEQTVIAGGFYSVGQICVPRLREDCRRLGLEG